MSAVASAPQGDVVYDREDKLPVNGVDLGVDNEQQLSSYQKAELQRYIDANRHLLGLEDRDKPPPPPEKPVLHDGKWGSLSGALHGDGLRPEDGYNSLEKCVKKSTTVVESSRGDQLHHGAFPLDAPRSRSVSPGFRDLPTHFRSRGISPNPLSLSVTSGGGGGTSPYSNVQEQHTFKPLENGRGYVEEYHYSSSSTTGRQPGSGISVLQRTQSVESPQQRPGSVTRKEVSWSAAPPTHHQQATAATGPAPPPPAVSTSTRRAPSPTTATTNKHDPHWFSRPQLPNSFVRSSSSASQSITNAPAATTPASGWANISSNNNNYYSSTTTNQMSHYGSSGSLARDQRTGSPASYAAMGRHSDNYNRYESARRSASREFDRQRRDDEESRFRGYGDRPGSGVEFAAHRWNGGEVLTDPLRLPRGPKPRRMFYSPIGDGVVAADGIELKRGPVDLTPKIEVIKQTHVERGAPGRGGVNIYEKNWSEYPGGGNQDAAFRTQTDKQGVPEEPIKLPERQAPPPPPARELDELAELANRPPPAARPDSGLAAFPVEDRGPSRISRPDSAVSSAFDPTFNYEFRTGYAITNPRELIHQYATTTPAAVMEVGDYCDRAQQQAQLGGVGGGDTVITEKYKKKTTTTTTTTSAADDERFVPYAPYRGTTQVAKPNQFVRQLRDETMTDSQRDANKQHEPRNQSLDPQKVSDIKRNVITRSGRQDEIDSLTQQMLVGLQTGHPTPPRYG